MDEMKYDMHGSATTFGVMQALVASGHKGNNRSYGMAENMHPQRSTLGDVIKTYSDKTVEVWAQMQKEDSFYRWTMVPELI